MCGRFYVNEDLIQKIEQLARRIEGERGKSRDVAPTQNAEVLCALEGEIVLRTLQWGYENFGKSGVIFNARAESVQEKRMFSDDFDRHRCLIPAGKFYEWKAAGAKEKEQYEFERKHGTMLLAGIYHKDPAGDRFTILTKAAEGCMVGIHDRMPVIIEETDITKWLFSKEEATKMLERSCSDLQRKRNVREQYEQLSLF